MVGLPHFPIHIFLNVEGDVRDGATERARLGIFRSNKPRSLKIVLGFPTGKCGGAAQIQQFRVRTQWCRCLQSQLRGGILGNTERHGRLWIATEFTRSCDLHLLQASGPVGRRFISHRPTVVQFF